jgi:hypothetical protein
MSAASTTNTVKANRSRRSALRKINPARRAEGRAVSHNLIRRDFLTEGVDDEQAED